MTDFEAKQQQSKASIGEEDISTLLQRFHSTPSFHFHGVFLLLLRFGVSNLGFFIWFFQVFSDHGADVAAGSGQFSGREDQLGGFGEEDFDRNL